MDSGGLNLGHQAWWQVPLRAIFSTVLSFKPYLSDLQWSFREGDLSLLVTVEIQKVSFLIVLTQAVQLY